MNQGKHIGGIRGFLILLLWIPFLATLIVAVLAQRAHDSNDRDTHWVFHTFQVKDQLEHINSLVDDVETGLGGYLLTGNDRFLTSYRAAREELPGQMQSMALLIADNPRQVARVAQLRSLIAEDLSNAGKLLALAEKDKNSAGIPAVEDATERLLDEIQADTKQMITEEDRLLEQRNNESSSQERIQGNLMNGLVSVDAALIVGATLLIWRMETSRQNAKARAVLIATVAEEARKRGEDAIRASEVRYRGLFEAAKDGILILDAVSGQVVDANPFMKELLGYSQEEFLGRKLWEIGPFKGVADSRLTFAELQHTDAIHYEALPLETRDGRRIEVEFISSSYQIGRDRLIQCNIRDITARKIAEQQMVLLDTCVSKLSDIVLLTEADATDKGGPRIVFVNKAFERMTGYTSDEALGQSPRFLQGEKTDHWVLAEIHEAVEKRRPIRRQLVNYRKDGTEFWLDIDIVPIFDLAGKCTNFAAIERDITESKRNEESLNLFRTLMERSIDAIEVIDPETGRFLDVNETACERLGYTREEMLSMVHTDIIVAGAIPFSSGKGLEELREAGFKVLEARHRRKDGSTFPIEVNVKYIELNRGYLVAVARDITERKRNEERFRRLVDSNVQGVFFWNAKGEITAANDAFLSLLEYTREEFEATPVRWSTVTPPEYADLDRRALEETTATGVCTPYEKEFLRRDGSRVPILIGSATFEDNPAEGVAFALDLTEQRRAAGQIAEQAVLLDEARDGIIVRGLDGTILSWSKGAERMYGWTRNEVIGGNVCDFYISDREEFDRTSELLLASGEWHGELRHHTRQGGTIIVGGRWTLIRDDEGNPKSVLVINTDITEQKNIEAQFMRAQRMESIGTLAGGIAHDLNNILSPIMMAIEILKNTSKDPQATSILATIEVSARRGADIVRQVLSFARGLEGLRVEVQPKHLLLEVENIIKNTFPKNITLRTFIPNDTWTILGDPTQIHQILLNLCVNARDAMQAGGALTIAVDNCVLEENHPAMNIRAKSGRYVHIAVSDSGCGIPHNIVDKIFEPFFTTKDLDKGTGLGLSTVMAILKSHDGNINISSEPDKGSTFNVYLPSMEMSAAARKAQEDEIRMPTGNGETVLVVDDESAILTIAMQTLEAFGYSVLTASDGAEAVAIYAQHRHEIAVVLTDMSMPVMDGPSTISALLRINPAIKIVAASGLASNPSKPKTPETRIKHFLAKPYTAASLLKAIRAILDDG